MTSAPNPLPLWWDAACKHACGIGTPRPAAMPKPAPAWAVAEWATWRTWNAWVLAGRPAPRPVFHWLTQTESDKRKAPQWAWVLKALYAEVHPRTQPAAPPAPEPRYSRWTLDQIGGFGVRLAWAFTQGSETPEQLVERFSHAREPNTGRPLRWLSIQGYPASDGVTFDGRSFDNEPFMDRFIRACLAAGIQPRLWERTDQVDYAHIKRIWKAHPGFVVYEADVELRPAEQVDPDIPTKWAADPEMRDVIRTILVAGMNPAEDYVKWIAAEFACATQAYAHENWAPPLGHPVPPGIANTMDRDAYWRGFPLLRGLNGKCSVPTISVNQEGDGGLEHQLSSVVDFGEHWGIEWGETLNAADRALLGI